MIGRPTAAGLDVRVTRLEGETGALSPAERVELERLQAEYDARFAGPIDSWSDDLLKAFIDDECAADGPARRLDELRERNAGPEQAAADRIRLCQALDVAESLLDGVIADALAQLCGDRRCRN